MELTLSKVPFFLKIASFSSDFYLHIIKSDLEPRPRISHGFFQLFVLDWIRNFVNPFTRLKANFLIDWSNRTFVSICHGYRQFWSWTVKFHLFSCNLSFLSWTYPVLQLPKSSGATSFQRTLYHFVSEFWWRWVLLSFAETLDVTPDRSTCTRKQLQKNLTDFSMILDWGISIKGHQC